MGNTEEGFWSRQLDNDLSGSSDDRLYTHGSKVSFTSIEEPPQFLDNLPDYIPFYDKGDFRLYGFEIAQTMLTPEDTVKPALSNRQCL